MLKYLSPKHQLLAVALASLAAACSLPLQSLQVDQEQPVALATVDTAPIEPAATLAATAIATTAPLPATLPGGLFATLWDEASETSSLLVVDPATGVLLETTASTASVISLTPDGRHLLLTGWEAGAVTQVLSLDGLAEVRRLDDREVHFTRDLTGQPVIVSQRFSATELSVSLLDPNTFAELAA